MLRYFSWKLPVGDCYRYGANVGFCDATTDMMLAPSLEIGCPKKLGAATVKTALTTSAQAAMSISATMPLRLGEEKSLALTHKDIGKPIFPTRALKRASWCKPRSNGSIKRLSIPVS